jgi:hypothetical protein
MTLVAWNEEGHFTTETPKLLVSRHTASHFASIGSKLRLPAFCPSQCGCPYASAQGGQGDGVAMT